jgi:hypothetical protein
MTTESPSVPTHALSKRAFWTLTVCTLLSWVPVLLGSEVITQVASLHSLSANQYPYFQPSYGRLLYVWTPVVVLSSFVLYLSPGAILVIALGRARNVTEWVVFAFGISLALTVVLSTTAKVVFGPPVTSQTLLLLWLGTTAVSWLVLAYRLHQAADVVCPVAGRTDARRMLWMLGAALAGVAFLVPKIFWENFNLDGIEAFEFGRSLTSYVLPHWEMQEGVFGFYHNFMLFSFPNHWFITMVGPVEAAVRLPFILYLVVLFAALMLLIEMGSARELSAVEEAVLWLGLALYTVVQAFNTNYEPFFADLAEMAATDTLVIALFLSACYSLLSDRQKWFWIFALMTCLAGPGGLLLFGALGVVTVIVRPANWVPRVKAVGAFILVWIAIGLTYEIFYNQLLLHGINNQFSAKNMLRRLYPPTLTEFVRFNALFVTCGVIPVVSFLAARRKDATGLMVVGITIIYFGVLYLQSWTALHQFTPVMILPLVFFWRTYLRASVFAQRWLLPSVCITTLLCVFFSLPQHFQINQAVREFGQATEYRIGDYNEGYEVAARGGKSLSTLLPEDYRMQYPEQPWGTDPYSWIYYATRTKSTGNTVNYYVQSEIDPPPPMTTRIKTEDGIAIYVRDAEVWRGHRERELPRVVVSRVYEPILRRTYQFFRAYVERSRQNARTVEESGEANAKEGKTRGAIVR